MRWKDQRKQNTLTNFSGRSDKFGVDRPSGEGEGEISFIIIKMLGFSRVRGFESTFDFVKNAFGFSKEIFDHGM